MITLLERQMILNIAHSQYNPVNGYNPASASDTVTYAFDVVNTPEDKGVISSLIKKGLVNFYKDPYDKDDNTVCLTEAGYAVYIESI